MAEINNTFLKTVASAYYRFESGALTTDSSPNAQTLTNNNTVTEGTGKYGGAATFASASSQYFSRADSASLSLTGGMAISFWINTTSLNQGKYFIGKANYTDASNNGGYTIRVYTSNARLGCELYNNGAISGGEILTPTSSLTSGTWENFVLNYDGSATVYWYKNGAEVASASHTVGVKDTADTFYIGRNPTSGFGAAAYLDGSLDEVALFDRTLSVAEIKDIYQESSGFFALL